MSPGDAASPLTTAGGVPDTRRTGRHVILSVHDATLPRVNAPTNQHSDAERERAPWLTMLHGFCQNAELIASLILEGPVVPGIDMPSVTAQIERARAIARARGVESAMEDWFLHAEWFRIIREDPVACRAAEQREILRAFRGRPLLAPLPASPALSLVDEVGRIDCPVLIYNGSNDLNDFLRVAAMLAGKLPHAEKVEIPELGGFPAWESPARVDGIVEAFLDGLDS